MRYNKTIVGGYIQSIGTGCGGTEITEQEYNNILGLIQNKPEGTGTIDYALKEDLTWEPFEIEQVDPNEEEITDSEAFAIIFGES